MTQLGFVLAVTLVIMALGFRPLGGGSLGDGPVSATSRDGDFELTIRAGHSRYAAGVPIDVSATLTYLGVGGPIEIGHDIGQDGAPIGFGVVEPIFPGYFLSANVSRLICHRSTFSLGESVVESFHKTGGGSGDGNGADFLAYMRDPVFWLNDGTWHANAVAAFSINPSPPGSCTSDILLQASIAITVGPRPGVGTFGPIAGASSVIAATETPLPGQPGTQRSTSDVQEGDFELALAAAKDTFSSDETLGVVASLTYVGHDPGTVIGSGPWGPIEFFMKAPGITLHPTSRSVCTELNLDRGRTLSDDLLDLYDVPQPFRMPHGLYEIAAFAAFRDGGCRGPKEDLRTTIVVAVSDGPDDIPLLTDVDSGGRACMLMRNGGQLVQSDTGLGVVDVRGNVREVIWPNGYSARRTADGAVLIGRQGQVIAREGYRLVFDAIDNGGPLWPCGDVEVEAPTTP